MENSMKKTKHHSNNHDAEVPHWITKAVDGYRVILFSDTRTYRLLVAIYWATVGIAFPHDISTVNRDEKTSKFLSWFIAKGNDISAYLGLMWLHDQLGERLTQSCGYKAANLADDPRLGYLLTVFILICDKDDDDPNIGMYYEMVCQGWEKCMDDRYKESLFRGLTAVLTHESLRELVLIGKILGHSSSNTKGFLANAREHFSSKH
jgi:hypothetical protein